MHFIVCVKDTLIQWRTQDLLKGRVLQLDAGRAAPALEKLLSKGGGGGGGHHTFYFSSSKKKIRSVSQTQAGVSSSYMTNLADKQASPPKKLFFKDPKGGVWTP